MSNITSKTPGAGMTKGSGPAVVYGETAEQSKEKGRTEKNNLSHEKKTRRTEKSSRNSGCKN